MVARGRPRHGCSEAPTARLLGAAHGAGHAPSEAREGAPPTSSAGRPIRSPSAEGACSAAPGADRETRSAVLRPARHPEQSPTRPIRFGSCRCPAHRVMMAGVHRVRAADPTRIALLRSRLIGCCSRVTPAASWPASGQSQDQRTRAGGAIQRAGAPPSHDHTAVGPRLLKPGCGRPVRCRAGRAQLAS